MNLDRGQYWDQSWSPVYGCSHEKAGEDGRCVAHCWAEKLAGRFSTSLDSEGRKPPFEGFATKTGWTGRVKLIEENLLKPLHWRYPRVIALNWMGDYLHKNIPDSDVDRIQAVMALCCQHRFLSLTKRSERQREYWLTKGRPGLIAEAVLAVASAAKLKTTGICGPAAIAEGIAGGWRLPLQNVGIGVSAENQSRIHERIRHLLTTPGVMRWVSIEPMLGIIDVAGYLGGYYYMRPAHSFQQLDWVVLGGESGSTARTCRVSDIRGAIRECRDAGIPCFVKQLGANPRGILDGYTKGEADWMTDVLDPKGANAAEWPADLRVRELPEFLK